MKLPLAQRARPDWLACTALGWLGASFVWLIVPPLQTWVWGLGLAVICPLLVRMTITTYSAIKTGRDGSLVLQLRNTHASIKSEIPCKYITRVEPCEFYFPGTSAKPATYPENDYHRVHTHLGYRGPGLIVSYRLPAKLGWGDVERVWQFPAPRAEEFMRLLKDHKIPEHDTYQNPAAS